jgi:L-ascorbate metabolism protein UlaG (beta-lactamase superfamily)
VLLRLAGTTVLTDPVFRDWLGPLRRHGPRIRPQSLTAPEVVLVSHLHRDHLDLRSLRRLAPSIPVVVPRGAAGLVARAGRDQIHEISPGESIRFGEITATAVPAVHPDRRGYWGRRAQPVGYLISGGHCRVYFAGDTDLFGEMADLAPLDVALLPVWGWGTSVGPGHLDPAGAARTLTLLRPRVAVPIHWGTFFPLGLRRMRPDRLSQPPLEFARLAGELAPQVRVRIVQPGFTLRLGERELGVRR